jgi:hypothetical protein
MMMTRVYLQRKVAMLGAYSWSRLVMKRAREGAMVHRTLIQTWLHSSDVMGRDEFEIRTFCDVA